MSQQAVSNYGNDCPVCHGTGWELYDAGEIPGYGKAHPYAKRCSLCTGIRRSSDITGVPPQFSDADISKFGFDIYSKDTANLKKLIQHYYEKFDKYGKNLYLWSKTPGSGKTFLACCLGKSIMMRYDLKMRFITMPDYLAMVGDSYKRQMGERDRSQIYRECDLLLLDDVGTQKNGEWKEETIFRLINERLNAGKVTIYTSNMPPEMLNIKDITISRIKNKTLVVTMPEESIRDKKSKAEQEEYLKELFST